MEGGGEWGSVITKREGEYRGRMMAESEGEWAGKEWIGVMRSWVWKCKANSIFYLSSYVFINNHFLIGKGHVCFASVAQGWS